MADANELARVLAHRPCVHVEPWVLPREWILHSTETAGHLDVRYHKVAAVAANAELYEGGTIYVDNDISLKRTHAQALFAVFDEMGAKAVGFNHDCTANPKHRIAEIPSHFCERNGGVMFMHGPRASVIAREWLGELRERPGPGGTDQMPLRRVLWRHRDALFDLPAHVQCRCRKASICARGALLWHLHRNYRLEVAARLNASAAGEVCGFYP